VFGLGVGGKGKKEGKKRVQSEVFGLRESDMKVCSRYN